MIPNFRFEIDPIDIAQIYDALAMTQDDIRTIATIIVEGMIERIDEKKTSLGETLSENSEWWQEEKRTQGYPTEPLSYKGVINDPATYIVRFISETEAIIETIPGFQPIHLELIEISHATGKNYKDWFGIADEDLEIVQDTLQDIMEDKIRDLTR